MIICKRHDKWRVCDGDKELSSHDGLVAAIRAANKLGKPYLVEIDE